MSLHLLIKTFPWTRYSKKMRLRIDTPYCYGSFSESEAKDRDLFFATSQMGSIVDGNEIRFYWLVDKLDGVIIDSKFQCFGNTALIAAGEVLCEIVIGKNYDQARRISADLIDKYVRDRQDVPAFPEETYGHINLAIDAIDMASNMCQEIPLAENYVAPPVMQHEIDVIEGGIPNWNELTLKQKIAVIEEVVDKEIRPYIELDAGGIEVINLLNDKEVIISYEGTCTTCHSATGATLSYIQQVLKARVHPELEVTPEF